MNATAEGLAYYSYPINMAPSGGTVDVQPLAGFAMKTYFTIIASDWVDEDLPLKYQFYYSINSDNGYNAILTENQFTSQTTSLLPASIGKPNLDIRVEVMDYFEAKAFAETSVQVTLLETTFSEVVTSLDDLFDSLQHYDPFETVRLISIIAIQISEWESATLAGTTITQACPFCSGHGYCPIITGSCICNSSWSYFDCSINSSFFDQVMELKMELLNSLDEQYKIIQDDTTKDLVYQTLTQISQDIHFNNNESLSKIQDILENTLGITQPDTLLSESETSAVADILNNMLSYASWYDCEKNTAFTAALADKTYAYMKVITKSMLNGKIPLENVTIIRTDSFDIYTIREGVCDLDGLLINLDTLSPKLSFRLDVSSLNCSEQVNLEYYAFDSNLMNCNVTADSNKNLIAINITDSNGNPTNLDPKVIISYSGEPLCPDKCIRYTPKSCQCDSISFFDVKTQIIVIFSKSQAHKLIKVSSLGSFPFWKSVAFWSILVLTIWYFVTIRLVKGRWAEWDIIEEFKKRRTRSKWYTFKTAFLLTHPLLSAYYLKIPELSKPTMATLFYSETVLLLAFSSVFAGTGAEEEAIQRLLSFNLYLFLLPYVIVGPIQSCLHWCLKISKKKVLNGENKKPLKLGIWVQRKLIIGRYFVALIVLTCLAIIIIIAANQNSQESKNWTVDFLKSLLQDLLLTPILIIIFQYFMLKLLRSKQLQKRPKIRYILINIADENIFDVIDTARLPKSMTRIYPTQLSLNSFSDKKPLKTDNITPIKSLRKIGTTIENTEENQQRYTRLSSISMLNNQANTEKTEPNVSRLYPELRINTNNETEGLQKYDTLRDLGSEERTKEVDLRESNVMVEIKNDDVFIADNSTRDNKSEPGLDMIASKLREILEEKRNSRSEKLPQLNISFEDDKFKDPNYLETSNPIFTFESMRKPSSVRKSIMRTLADEENNLLTKTGVHSIPSEETESSKPFTFDNLSEIEKEFGDKGLFSLSRIEKNSDTN